MLLAGMDVSGRPHVDNYMYLAIVLGTDESINALFNKLNLPKKHMSAIHMEKQDQIVNDLDFDCVNRTAFCITINRKQIIETIKNHRRMRSRNISYFRLYSMFERNLFKYLRDDLGNFILQHKESITELSIQCDNDSRNFIRTWGLKPAIADNAHKIADVVAWCNNKEISVSGVIDRDYRKKIIDDIFSELKI